MLRLRSEVHVHPEGTVPGVALRRYPAGTPVVVIPESEGWQLSEDHFFDDDTEHPVDVIAAMQRRVDDFAALGLDPPAAVVDWISTQTAAIAAAENAENEEATDAVR